FRTSRVEHRDEEDAGKRSGERQDQRGPKQIAPLRFGLHGGSERAEQDRRPQRKSTVERDVGERKADQDAEKRGQTERLPVDCRSEGQSNDGPDIGKSNQCQDCPGRTAKDNSDGGERHYLDQEVGKDLPAGRAQRLPGRDGPLTFGYISSNGVAHAQPADEQRRQADDCKEASEEIEIARKLLGRVIRRTDLPAGVWKGALAPLGSLVEGNLLVQEYLV